MNINNNNNISPLKTSNNQNENGFQDLSTDVSQEHGQNIARVLFCEGTEVTENQSVFTRQVEYSDKMEVVDQQPQPVNRMQGLVSLDILRREAHNGEYMNDDQKIHFVELCRQHLDCGVNCDEIYEIQGIFYIKIAEANMMYDKEYAVYALGCAVFCLERIVNQDTGIGNLMERIAELYSYLPDREIETADAFASATYIFLNVLSDLTSEQMAIEEMIEKSGTTQELEKALQEVAQSMDHIDTKIDSVVECAAYWNLDKVVKLYENGLYAEMSKSIEKASRLIDEYENGYLASEESVLELRKRITMYGIAGEYHQLLEVRPISAQAYKNHISELESLHRKNGQWVKGQKFIIGELSLRVATLAEEGNRDAVSYLRKAKMYLMANDCDWEECPSSLAFARGGVCSMEANTAIEQSRHEDALNWAKLGLEQLPLISTDSKANEMKKQLELKLTYPKVVALLRGSTVHFSRLVKRFQSIRCSGAENHLAIKRNKVETNPENMPQAKPSTSQKPSVHVRELHEKKIQSGMQVLGELYKLFDQLAPEAQVEESMLLLKLKMLNESLFYAANHNDYDMIHNAGAMILHAVEKYYPYDKARSLFYKATVYETYGDYEHNRVGHNTNESNAYYVESLNFLRELLKIDPKSSEKKIQKIVYKLFGSKALGEISKGLEDALKLLSEQKN